MRNNPRYFALWFQGWKDYQAKMKQIKGTYKVFQSKAYTPNSHSEEVTVFAEINSPRYIYRDIQDDLNSDGCKCIAVAGSWEELSSNIKQLPHGKKMKIIAAGVIWALQNNFLR